MWFSLIYAISEVTGLPTKYNFRTLRIQFVFPLCLNKASFLTETDDLLTC